MDGVDDFVVVDPLLIHRGDPEVDVAELALDDVQRDPLAASSPLRGSFDRPSMSVS